jgi:hypothetical protein
MATTGHNAHETNSSTGQTQVQRQPEGLKEITRFPWVLGDWILALLFAQDVMDCGPARAGSDATPLFPSGQPTAAHVSLPKTSASLLHHSACANRWGDSHAKAARAAKRTGTDSRQKDRGKKMANLWPQQDSKATKQIPRTADASAAQSEGLKEITRFPWVVDDWILDFLLAHGVMDCGGKSDATPLFRSGQPNPA